MDAILTAVIPDLTKAFGVFSTLLILLGAIIWHLRTENRELRKKLDEVQETRIREAQELIRVTERSTETQLAKIQTEQASANLLQLVTALAKGAQDASLANRQLLEQIVDVTPRQSMPRGGA